MTNKSVMTLISVNKISVCLSVWYSNEAERANWDIYDDFKLKKPFGLHGLYKNIQHFKG